jgi:hypothetical protein
MSDIAQVKFVLPTLDTSSFLQTNLQVVWEVGEVERRSPQTWLNLLLAIPTYFLCKKK